MALITCYECGGKVSTLATSCPHCGAPVRLDSPAGEIHDYVNLGLPSGTLWATCNIGAYAPEKYGLYFQWGDTQGYPSDTDDGKLFDIEHCKHLNSEEEPTKYCEDDGRMSLDLEDDAAYVNWGMNWRMPSLEQFEELIDERYTTQKLTTLNGVEGCMITSKSNGKTIFLPAAGYRSDSYFYYGGSRGYYWSRTLNSDYPYYAWDLYFSSDDVYTYDDDRTYGHSVRSVRR